MSLSVFEQLSHSKATLAHHHVLGQGCAAALWANQNDYVVYETQPTHTLSLYLKGGTKTRRLDRGGVYGFEGSLCVLPQGSRSEWLIGANRFSFVHLYVTQARLRQFIVETYDREPPAVDLPDLTYFDEPCLKATMKRLADACAQGDGLAAQSAAQETLHALFNAPNHRFISLKPKVGGLPPHVSKRVVARLHEELDAPLSLETLADEAHLSPFHFQRMFRVSHGVSPHGYRNSIKILLAKDLMRQGLPLAHIALRCGYCHQSHFSRSFRAATGLSPQGWLKAIQSG